MTLQRAKKLLFYTHQTFLILIELILHRLPAQASHNLWAHSLQAILLNKRVETDQYAADEDRATNNLAEVMLESQNNSF